VQRPAARAASGVEDVSARRGQVATDVVPGERQVDLDEEGIAVIARVVDRGVAVVKGLPLARAIANSVEFAPKWETPCEKWEKPRENSRFGGV